MSAKIRDYVQLPLCLINNNIPQGARLVLIKIYQTISAKHQETWIGANQKKTGETEIYSKQLAWQLGMTVDTVRRLIRFLIKTGVVDRYFTKMQIPVYSINLEKLDKSELTYGDYYTWLHADSPNEVEHSFKKQPK